MPIIGTKSARELAAYKARLRRALMDHLPDVLGRMPIVTDRRARVRLPGHAGTLPTPGHAGWAGPVEHHVAREDPRISRPGQPIGRVDPPQGGAAGGPEAGTEAVDHAVELVLDEEDLWELIADHWHLRDLRPTDATTIPSDAPVWTDRRPVGAPSRWLRRHTMRERFRHRGGLRATDLRYRHARRQDRPVAQAVVMLVRDISGSMMSDAMTQRIRAVAFCLTHWLRRQYPAGVDLVFATYDYAARLTDEPTFFGSVPGGGTRVVAALDLLTDLQATRYPPAEWNAYLVVFTDGEDAMPAAVLPWLAAAQTAWRQLGWVHVADAPGAATGPSNLFPRLVAWGTAHPQVPLVITDLTSEDDVAGCLADLVGGAGA